LLEELAYRFAMGFIPKLNPLLFREVFALVQFHVALVAKRRDPIVMRFQAAAFAVSELVRMRRYYRTIRDSAMLAR